MIDTNLPEIRFAIDTIREAATLVKHIQESMIAPSLTKDDRSPVTIADFASQALVGYRLRQAFPTHPLVGEESSDTLRTAEERSKLKLITGFLKTILPEADENKTLDWIDIGKAEPAQTFWTIDPIDGTKGFMRGQQYAVAFAMLQDHEVVIGGLGCPNLTDGYQEEIGGPGSLLIAARGQGTWVTALNSPEEFKRVIVSDINKPVDARFLRSFEAAHTNVGQLDYIAQEMKVDAEPVRLDSQAKYAILASGAGDAIFRLISAKSPDYKEKIWDQAAGSIVAEEAGGMVTDLDGKPLDFSQGRKLLNNRGVLATNKHLHQAALEAIKAVKA